MRARCWGLWAVLLTVAGAQGALPTDFRAEATRLSDWLRPTLAGDVAPEALALPVARWELLRRVGPDALITLAKDPAFLDALWGDQARLEKFLANATAQVAPPRRWPSGLACGARKRPSDAPSTTTSCWLSPSSGMARRARPCPATSPWMPRAPW